MRPDQEREEGASLNGEGGRTCKGKAEPAGFFGARELGVTVTAEGITQLAGHALNEIELATT